MGSRKYLDRNRKLSPSFRNMLYYDIQSGIIDRENRPKNKPQKGIRQTILEAYNRGGRKEALKELEAINKRLGKTVYTVEMMDSWIKQSKFLDGLKVKDDSTKQEKSDIKSHDVEQVYTQAGGKNDVAR